MIFCMVCLAGQEYYTVSFSPATYQTQFAVIALEDATTVEFNLKAAVVYEMRTYRSSELSVTLSQYELFQVR